MKNLFGKIINSVKSIFGKGFDLFRDYSYVAVKVTDQLKYVVESPFADLATNLIPSDIDNIILVKLRKALPKVAIQVAITHGILSTHDKNSDAIINIIEYLKKLNPDARAGFWITFSAQINIALSDDKLTLSEAVILAQMAFKEMKK